MDDKDASERYFCPFPGCKRSFAELWRLKVHYRAPPDIRGSGKERGHGCELTHCPKCGKGLKPGKHHVGCSGSKTAPRQAKRSRQGGGNGTGLPGDGMTADVQGMYSAGMMVQGSYAPGMPAPAPNGYTPLNGGYHQQYQAYPQQYQPDMSGNYYQGQINPMAPGGMMQQQQQPPMQQVQAQPLGGVPSPALMGAVPDLSSTMVVGSSNPAVQPDGLMSAAQAQPQPIQYQYQQPAPMPPAHHVLQHQGPQSQDMLQPLLQPGMEMQQVMHQPMQQQPSIGMMDPVGMVPFPQQQQQQLPVTGMMDPMAQGMQQQQQQSFQQQMAGVTATSSGTFMPQQFPHQPQLVQQHSGGVSQSYIGHEPAAGVSAAAAAGLMPPPPPVTVMQPPPPQLPQQQQQQQPPQQQPEQQPQLLPSHPVVSQQQQFPPQPTPAAAHLVPASPSSTSSNTAALLPPAPPGPLAPQPPAASAAGFSDSLFDEIDNLDAAAGVTGAAGDGAGSADLGRAPSPPPLPADFPQAAGQGMLFNFSQFSQKLPAAAPPSQQMAMMPRGMEQELPPSMDDLWTPEATYDHHSDGDLMQLLFGAPEQPPTMATIHLHHFLEDDACSSPLLTGMIGGSMDDLNAAARQAAAAPGQQYKQEQTQLEDPQGAVGGTKGLMLPPAAQAVRVAPAVHQEPQTPQQLAPLPPPVEHLLVKQELMLPASQVSQQHVQQPMSYVPPNGSAGVIMNGQCGATGMVQIKGEDGNCLLHKAEFTILSETLASRAT